MHGHSSSLASQYLKHQEYTQRSSFVSYHHRSRAITKLRHHIGKRRRPTRFDVPPAPHSNSLSQSDVSSASFLSELNSNYSSGVLPPPIIAPSEPGAVDFERTPTGSETQQLKHMLTPGASARIQPSASESNSTTNGKFRTTFDLPSHLTEFKETIDSLAFDTLMSPAERDTRISRVLSLAIHARDSDELTWIVKCVATCMMHPELKDAPRDRLLMLLDQLILSLEERIRPYTHHILVVTQCTLLEDSQDTVALGRQVITHLIEVVGLATMITVVAEDAKNDDGYIRESTAKTLALMTLVCGFEKCKPFLKAVCTSKHWTARCTGTSAIRSLVKLVTSKHSEVARHVVTARDIISMIDLIESNLSHHKSAVRKAAVFAMIALVELIMDTISNKLICAYNLETSDKALVKRSILRDSLKKLLWEQICRVQGYLQALFIQAFCSIGRLMPSRDFQRYLDSGLSDLLFEGIQRSLDVNLQVDKSVRSLRAALWLCLQCRGIVLRPELIELQRIISKKRAAQREASV